MITISILVPVYNVESYLVQCLESIKNQTFQNFEVICINDGSTDHSLEIIKKFIALDQRFKLIDKSNTGYGHSMNKGLAACQGEYVSIVESDDYILPNMLERLYQIASTNNLDVARCNYYKFSKKKVSLNNELIDKIPHNKLIKPLNSPEIFYQSPSIWVNLYRKDFLIQNNIKFLETPGASYQDTSFAFKVYALCERFMFINEPLLNYRVDNSGSSINDKQKMFCVCDEYQEIVKFTKKNLNIYKILKFHIPVLRYNCYRWNFLRINHNSRKKFLKIWQKEIIQDYSENRIQKNYFGRKKYLNVFLIKNFPFIYNMLKFFIKK
ncbi:glycosyltransferase [Snodgrassella alvi]|uniref:glycosyltransferase n=1 Tax=Snodgrassella alvi TaxID=1196083 RepID=UPI00351A912D